MCPLISLQYIKQRYPRAEEGQKIDLDLSIQNDIEFDIQKYHHKIPQDWMIMPWTQPLRVGNYTIISNVLQHQFYLLFS